MGRAVGGASAVGCGGLSLVGILISVGLVVFLGGQVLDGVGGAGRSGTTTTTPAAGTDPAGTDSAGTDPASTLAIDERATVVLDPADGLTDGVVVTATGAGLPPGPVLVSTCLTALVEQGGTTACDPAVEASATVDAEGTFERDLTVARTIVVGATRFDCAALAGGCSVLVHQPDAGAGPTAPLTFTPELGAIDAEPPPRT